MSLKKIYGRLKPSLAQISINKIHFFTYFPVQINFVHSSKMRCTRSNHVSDFQPSFVFILFHYSLLQQHIERLESTSQNSNMVPQNKLPLLTVYGCQWESSTPVLKMKLVNSVLMSLAS